MDGNMDPFSRLAFSKTNKESRDEGKSVSKVELSSWLEVSQIATVSKRRRPRCPTSPPLITKVAAASGSRYKPSIPPRRTESARMDSTYFAQRTKTVRMNNLTRNKEYDCENLEYETRLKYLNQLRKSEENNKRMIFWKDTIHILELKINLLEHETKIFYQEDTS
jgi:hypothetical protein